MVYAAPPKRILWRGRRRVAVGLVEAGSPVPALELNFVDGIYRTDGVTYASAEAAGWTVLGGTFDANGYTPTGTNRLLKTVNLTPDFIVVAKFVPPPAGGNRQIWEHVNYPNPGVMKLSSGSTQTNPLIATYPDPTRVAFGKSGGVYRVSFNRGAVSVGSSDLNPGSGFVVVGNNQDSVYPTNSPIEYWAAYFGTFTDAQIQAM